MFRKRMTIVATTGFAVFTLSTFVLGENPAVSPIERASEDLMQAKLTSSQNVLEGLCRKDFRLIAQGAREMKRISEAAEWPRQRDPVYEHFSAEFRRQCAVLEDLAQKENHEAASFTYLHMTNVCIGCHNYVRDSLRIAESKRAGELHRGNDVQLIPSQWPQREVQP